MRIPTAETIQRTGCDRKTALKIRRVLDGRLDPRKASEACDRWVRECYHEPSKHEQQLEAVNELLGGHGVEALDIHESDYYADNGVRMCPMYSYVNMGDTYNTTILRDHKRHRWVVAAWGDVVEWEERDHG